MAKTMLLEIPVNRVEGDLEVRVEIKDGQVTDAWSTGTMFRGFENIMVGRGALDGLVITPRVCGICGVAHLTAASRALDMITKVKIPPDAVRIRNFSLMAEHIQSDIRHSFLMFTVDMVNPCYQKSKLYDEAIRRYAPFKGETVKEVIRETKRVLEMIAIVGGQWPHSSFMVPGGVASLPSEADLRQCQLILRQYRQWYEKRILGCRIEELLEIETAQDLDNWLKIKEHAESDLGFFIRYAREIGLDKLGRSHGNFISYGYLDLPKGTEVKSLLKNSSTLIPGGFIKGSKAADFNQKNIAEHVASSWFADYSGGKHPFEGETIPYASGREGKKYSWAKAPRYDDLPAETGPLAEMMVSKIPLFTDLVKKAKGPNVLLRQLARLLRPALLIPAMEKWLEETTGDGKFYNSPGKIVNGEGYGLTHAARGALGHWVKIKDGKICHYQIITPTAWHASPRDANGIRGITEEALIGVPVKDAGNPVAVGHVVRSFDHCLVCTVHAVGRNRQVGHYHF